MRRSYKQDTDGRQRWFISGLVTSQEGLPGWLRGENPLVSAAAPPFRIMQVRSGELMFRCCFNKVLASISENVV